jgi:hypothetical protein
MQHAQTRVPPHSSLRLDRLRLIVFLLILIPFIILAVGLFRNQSGSAYKSVMSEAVLAQKYGLKVNLVALTAAGGMVDVRLKILDGAKAKVLLEDPKQFPRLMADNSNILIYASQDDQTQFIRFDDGGNVMLVYPNSGNAVKQGETVRILFGDSALEPVPVK